MKIKVIIVDDESHARSLLKKLCELYFFDRIEVVDECESVAKAIKSIRKYEPDLVFLDVQMPDENGFELFAHFEKVDFEVIFTTAYKEFAVQAIRQSALDYLVKPINVEEFKTAVSRFSVKNENKVSVDRFALLMDSITNQFVDRKRLVLPTKTGFEVVQVSSIVYCKSDGSYSTVFTTDSEYFTSKSFKELEDMLDNLSFIRVHRSFIINKDYVKGFKSDEFKLEMITGEHLPVSDTLFNKKKLIDVIKG